MTTFHCNTATWCFVIFMFDAARALSSGVVPSDFVTITPIKAVGGSIAEAAYAGSINATSFGQPLTSVKTVGGDRYQFVAYYGSTQKLVIGRRKLLAAGWSDWTLRKTAFTSNAIGDSHDVVSIGVDGAGYLHASWGMHCNSMLYTRSNASVLNDDDFALVGDTVGNSAGLGSEFSLNTSVTYPQFTSIPGSGDLLMNYRTGSSGNGKQQLYRWSNTGQTWSAVRASSTTPWINSDYSGDSSPNVCAYHNGLVFDSQGVLHTTWTWRTGADSTSGWTDYQSNHNVMYARSPDNGVNWYKDDGALYARAGVHAIDEDNATSVIALPEGSSLINTAGMAVGPDDTVYMASWWAPKTTSGDYLRQYMLNWYDGATWHTTQISDRDPEYVNSSGASQRVPESKLGTYQMGRPAVAVDDANRVIVAFSDWQRGGKVSIAISQSAQRNDWDIYDLNSVNMSGWEPTIDLSRWQDDGVISMYYQPLNGTAASVLEWNAGAYFAAAAPEPSTWGLLLSGLLAVMVAAAFRRRRAIADTE